MAFFISSVTGIYYGFRRENWRGLSNILKTFNCFLVEDICRYKLHHLLEGKNMKSKFTYLISKSIEMRTHNMFPEKVWNICFLNTFFYQYNSWYEEISSQTMIYFWWKLSVFCVCKWIHLVSILLSIIGSRFGNLMNSYIISRFFCIMPI